MSDAPAADDDALADQIGRIADEFTEALHRGENPDIDSYARRYPEVASVLREVLPTLQALGASMPPVAATAAPRLPDVLDDYRLGRELGRGGMGIVFEAEQISLKRRVALKVLPVHPALEARYLGRFEREAKTAAALHHTNIVPVFAVGCAQGIHYYAMQLIEGRGLDVILNDMRSRVTSPAALAQVQEEQAQQFPEPLHEQGARPNTSDVSRAGGAPPAYFLAVARMGLQVAEALEYAHERGVVHRDIKPSNLILDQAGILWITDFGLVKHLDGSDDNLTRTGDILGTARYMSPEQAVPKRGPVDARSDIYALGVTLYELLTLQPAFAATDQATLLQQIADEEPVPPRQRNRAVPRDLETIVLRAMAKEPRQRFRSAAALAADLRRFIAGEPIQARSRGVVERVWKWARRRPAVAALVAVSVLAAVSLTAGAIWSNAELRAANERERQRALEAEERERIGRRHLYAAHLSLARQAWDRGYSEQVRTALDRELPTPDREDLRGFEWYYFWNLSHRERRSWVGHRRAVSAVVFAPQARFLATASYDHTIKFWDPATGALLRTIQVGPPTSLALSGDGKTLVAGNYDGTVRVWDTAGGKELAVFRGHTGPVHGVALRGDGAQLASAGADGDIRLWDAVGRGKESIVLHGHTGAVWSVAYHPDGKHLASGGADETTRLWTLGSDEVPVLLKGHTAAVRAVAYTPDGTLLATGSADHTIKLWDVATARSIATLEAHSNPVVTLAFSPDGATLASGGGGDLEPRLATSRAMQLRARPASVKLWDVLTRQQRAILRGHTSPVCAVAFADDGRTLASTGQDLAVFLWNLDGIEPRNILPTPGKELNAVAVAPDGKSLLTASDDQTARLWDIATGLEQARPDENNGPVKAVAFNAEGTRFAIAAGDKRIRLYDAGTRAEVRKLEGHVRQPRALAFSPDGKTLASGGGDFGAAREIIPGEARLWDLAGQRPPIDLIGHTDIIRTVAFSLDGKLLVTGSDDCTAKIWDAGTGKLRQTLGEFAHSVRSAAFSPDGKTLAIACGGVWNAHEPGDVTLWDLEEGKTRLVLRGHRAGVLAVAYAPNGRVLATGSIDGTIKFWDAVTGEERAVLEGHRGLVRALAFTPNGRVLASVDSQGMTRLWFAAGEP